MGLHLDHLALGSPDPQLLAEFYRDAMCNAIEQQGDLWLIQGPERRLTVTSGNAKELKYAALGMAPAEFVALSQRLADMGIEYEPVQIPYLGSEAVAITDPDGNRIVLGISKKPDEPDVPLRARLQHLAFATTDIKTMVAFYSNVLGLSVSDNVRDNSGALRACFMHSDEEHHILALFEAGKCWFDHHCYEAGEWNLIRDWADHMSTFDIALKWGPGRHGPGNNLFFMVHDPDGNWVEISAELEIMAAERPTGEWLHAPKTLNYWGQAFLRN